MTLGERIRELRKSKNLSQRDLAEKANILPQTIGFIELDKYKTPGMDKLQKIAVALEVDPNELFSLAGYPTKEPLEKQSILQELEHIEYELHQLINKIKQG